MALYENIFLVRHNIAPHAVEGLAEFFSDNLSSSGGKVVGIEYWGLRLLAYRMKKNRKAYYVQMNIDAPYDAVSEMERQMKLNENVLSFMTVRVSKFKGDSAIVSQK